MKLKTLSLFIAVATATTVSLPAQAIYNLYKKDGLSLDINGEINVHAKQDRIQFDIQNPQGASQILGNNPDGTPAIEALMAGHHAEYSDRRVRLGQDEGASWTEFRGSQLLPNDWRVTGTVGFGYYDSVTGVYLSNANLAFDKKNLGSVSVGRQYLHTGYVVRTGTFNPLDSYATRSVRLDYTAIPNFHLSGYYSTASSDDVREESTADIEGFGASASYRHPIGDKQSLRVAGGYTKGHRNPPSTGRASNLYSTTSQGVAGSLEYRYGDFLIAGDVGRRTHEGEGTVIKTSQSDIMGVKVGYDLTPKLSLAVGYGTKNSKNTNKEPIIGVYNADACIDVECTNLVSPFELNLTDTKETNAYVQGDYYLRDNVRLYGLYNTGIQQATLGNKDFAKFKGDEYRLGVSFTF